jgi:hypothetical protein
MMLYVEICRILIRFDVMGECCYRIFKYCFIEIGDFDTRAFFHQAAPPRKIKKLDAVIIFKLGKLTHKQK